MDKRKYTRIGSVFAFEHISGKPYMAISAYEEVKDPENWHECKNCGLKPLIWIYDNERATACGCGENQYRHFSVFAESIASVVKHSENGQSVVDYDVDALRKNWNHWVETGEFLFTRENGRW